MKLPAKLLCVLTLLLNLSLQHPLTLDADEIVVELREGRVVEGTVDRKRTDIHRLWIQQESEGVSVSSAFVWETIAAITTRPAEHTAAPRHPAKRTVGTYSFIEPPTVAQRVPLPRRTSVSSIAFETALGNWDRDDSLDGILLTIYPLDKQRRIVPHTGTVYATLYTWETDQAKTRLKPTERWSRRVTESNVFADGVEIQLPFKALRSEKERYLRDAGLLQVRFSVPGMGNYRAEGVVPLSTEF